MTMKTYTPKSGDIQEQWYVVDAADQVVGRLASRIAMVLRGKNDPRFTPHANMRNHVIVINAEKVRFTGRKWQDKKYYRHTGWVGGVRELTAEQMHQKKPTDIIWHAVKGMIPHNRLGDATMKRLRVYEGAEHQHQAQQPQPLDLSRK